MEEKKFIDRFTFFPSTLYKITYARVCRKDCETTTCVCSFIEANRHYIEFGHPMSLSKKTGMLEVTSGSVGLLPEDIISIDMVTIGELEQWRKLTKEFSMDVIREKGYDICAEETDVMNRYLGPERIVREFTGKYPEEK